MNPVTRMDVLAIVLLVMFCVGGPLAIFILGTNP